MGLLSGTEEFQPEGAGLQTTVNVAAGSPVRWVRKGPELPEVKLLPRLEAIQQHRPTCGLLPCTVYIPPPPWEESSKRWTPAMWLPTSPLRCPCPGVKFWPRSCSIYLRFLCTQHVHHHLHHCLVHAEDSHEVGVLVKHLVVHYVSRVRIGERRQLVLTLTLWEFRDEHTPVHTHAEGETVYMRHVEEIVRRH